MNRDEGRKGRRLSEDETRLWHGVVKSVAPLRKRHAAKVKDDGDPSVAVSKAAPKAPPKKSVPHAAPVMIAKPPANTSAP